MVNLSKLVDRARFALLVGVAATIFTSLSPGVAHAAPYDITEYSTLSADSAPFAIAPGFDNRVWILQNASNHIASVAADGQMVEYEIPSPNSGSQYLATGADQTVWFVERNTNMLARLRPDISGGEFTEYPIPDIGADCGGIVVAANGHPWFVHGSTDQISTFDPDTEAVTSYSIPTTGGCPMGITFDTAGNLWFTQTNNDLVVRLDVGSGTFMEFPVPTVGSVPAFPTLGPDGSIWISQPGANKVARVNPGSGEVTEFPLDTPNSQPYGIVAGPEGDIWFAAAGAHYIGMLDSSTGEVTEYPTPTPGSFPFSITLGADNNIWFTESAISQVGRLELPNPVVDVNITKELVSTGTIQVGDTIEYRIAITNEGSTSAGDRTVAIYDFVPDNLSFVGSVSDSYECIDFETEEPEDFDSFIQQTVPNHPTRGAVVCNTDDDLDPNDAMEVNLRFVVESIPTEGFINYVLAPGENGEENDPDLVEFYDFFFEYSGTPEGDLIDAFETGPLAGNRNIASARYEPSAAVQTDAGSHKLADSGTNMALRALVAFVLIGSSSVVLTRRVWA